MKYDWLNLAAHRPYIYWGKAKCFKLYTTYYYNELTNKLTNRKQSAKAHLWGKNRNFILEHLNLWYKDNLNCLACFYLRWKFISGIVFLYTHIHELPLNVYNLLISNTSMYLEVHNHWSLTNRISFGCFAIVQ